MTLDHVGEGFYAPPTSPDNIISLEGIFEESWFSSYQTNSYTLGLYNRPLFSQDLFRNFCSSQNRSILSMNACALVIPANRASRRLLTLCPVSTRCASAFCCLVVFCETAFFAGSSTSCRLFAISSAGSPSFWCSGPSTPIARTHRCLSLL